VADSNKIAAGRAHKRQVELVSVLLLSLAGVVTAWCGFQAALWGGIQSTHYARASELQVEATGASTHAGLLGDVDLVTFLAWSAAFTAKNQELQEFYRARFRAEFKRAFEEWFASKPLTNPDAAPTPFALPSYKVSEKERAGLLSNQASQEFEQGEAANDRSDQYSMATVVLALVLLLAGLVQQFNGRTTQRTMLTAATLLLVFGIFRIANLPVAPWPHHGKGQAAWSQTRTG
jgi:hypothetical protein